MLSTAFEDEDESCGKKVINFLCGFESGKGNNYDVNAEKSPNQEGPPKTQEELAKEAAEFLDEPPFWKK